MNILKNTLGKMLLPLAIMFTLNSCYDESSPPGCETVDKPVLSQTSLQVEEGQTITIPMPAAPDEETTVSIVGPKDVEISYYSNSSEATIYNATQEKGGTYKIFYTQNHCTSEPANFTVNVSPPAVKCTIPDNVIRFQNLGYDLKYNSISCGSSWTNDDKFSISGGGSQSDFEIFFGTTTAPASARSFPISNQSQTFMGKDEVIIRVLLGGNWYYASGDDNKRLNVTIENGTVVATFCEMKFSGPMSLIGSGRLICR